MALSGESQVHQLVKSKTSQRHLIGRPSVPPIEGKAAGLVRLHPKNQNIITGSATTGSSKTHCEDGTRSTELKLNWHSDLCQLSRDHLGCNPCTRFAMANPIMVTRRLYTVSTQTDLQRYHCKPYRMHGSVPAAELKRQR